MKPELKIKFEKANSKLFGKVIRMAEKLEGYYHKEDSYEITFSREDLRLKWDSFYEIYGLVCNWKSFSLHLNNAEIPRDKANRTVNDIKEVMRCFKNYLIYEQKDFHCNQSPFGCLNITSINMNAGCCGNDWYLYGHFEDDAKKWIIHKKEIQLILEKEIERKQLFFCSVFSTDKIDEIIESFPDFIDMDNEKDNWEIVYEKRFVGARVVDIPESIRHKLIPDPEPEYFQNDSEKSDISNEEAVNPFEGGTDEWANWEIDNYLKKSLQF